MVLNNRQFVPPFVKKKGRGIGFADHQTKHIASSTLTNNQNLG